MKTILTLITVLTCVAFTQAESYKISVPTESNDQRNELVEGLIDLTLKKHEWTEFKTKFDLAFEEKYPDQIQKKSSFHFKSQPELERPNLTIKMEKKNLVTIEIDMRENSLEKVERLKEDIVSEIKKSYPNFIIQRLNPEIAV